MPLLSALYSASVTHTRTVPKLNRFTYSLCMAMVDLDELQSGQLDTWPWFSSRTPWALSSLTEKDHCIHSFDPTSPKSLRERVLEVLRNETGTEIPINARVRLMTGLRVCGIEFNPVSFFLIYLDRANTETVDYVIAEVNNIPWLEQHLYILEPSPMDDKPLLRPFKGHPKAFHVSPFIDMENIRYSWLISNPGDNFRMKIGLERHDHCFFMAGFNAKRCAFSLRNLIWMHFAHPMQSLKVMIAIMWEAGKLFRLGFEFVPHPNETETRASRAIATVVGSLRSVFMRGR